MTWPFLADHVNENAKGGEGRREVRVEVKIRGDHDH